MNNRLSLDCTIYMNTGNVRLIDYTYFGNGRKIID
jgi:hypothetical protein